MNAYIKLFAIVQYIDYNIHVHLFLFYSIVLIYNRSFKLINKQSSYIVFAACPNSSSRFDRYASSVLS